MTERMQRMKEYLNTRKHRAGRRNLTEEEMTKVLAVVRDRSHSYMRRHTDRLKLFLEMEQPVLVPDSQIFGFRTIRSFPTIMDEAEKEELAKTRYIHERGDITNVSWGVESVLKEGLEGRRSRLLNGKKADTEFVECANELLNATENFADRYAAELVKAGRAEEATALSRAIRTGAETLLEAFQVFRIVHFVIWCSDCYHNTAGRFDQWALAFYRHDIENGIETPETALDKIEDFFLSFNWDSDLYNGMEQGDNGQSMVLGGCRPDGSDAVNELTELALIAARENRQIDPKINLRVNKNTPLSLYEKGTELTKVGLGFPQYTNDDVVIPCLKQWGYADEDANNYAIAACWETIIPEVAMDIPNVNGIPLAELTRDTVVKYLPECDTVEALLEHLAVAIRAKVLEVTEGVKDLFLIPAPFLSMLMRDCPAEGRDLSEGAKYNNFGLHGTGLSCAADQLAAIQSVVFSGKVTKERLLKGMENSFAEDKELQYILRNEADKMGRDELGNEYGNRILNLFADSVEGLKTCRNGVWRVGTGTAMYYVWHARNLGATADGRNAGEFLPANFSPSLFLTNAGPLSVLLGFTPEALKRTSNGGPMTFEIHDTVFKEEDSIRKVAQLVQAYIHAGGHQLQINAVNAEMLKEAQRDPENHWDLIVRVWGWSGHFVELDKCYQDQVLSRVEYGV